MLHDITELRFFVTITESGSLAEAARRLDVTPSAVSQRLRHLEARLGMPLAQRSTRRFELTEEGEQFRDGVAAVLEQLDHVVDSLRERSGALVGRLSIAAPTGFGRHHVAPAIAEFQAQHPRLRAALSLSDTLSPIDAGRYDIAVHMGAMVDPGISTQLVAPNNRYICAAPAYLARHPPPKDPAELARHEGVVLCENNQELTLWRLRKRRHDMSVRVPVTLSSTDEAVVKAWGLAGKGLFLGLEWDVAEHLAAGELVRVLPEWSLPNADVVAVAARRGPLPRRVQLFLAFLQARFQPAPPWRADLPKKRSQ